MHRFERCQSTESMIGDQGGSGKSHVEPGTVLGTKSAKRSRDVFHDVRHCLPLLVDNKNWEKQELTKKEILSNELFVCTK